jgi:hypothetical protein
MRRFVPKGKRAEKVFLLLVQSLPGGFALSEAVAQRLLYELDYRRGVSTYGPDGSHFHLMEVSDIVAREFSGLLRYAVIFD